MTRSEVNAVVWLNNSPIPETLCQKEPELYNYGFYRRLNSGDLEFITFCSPEAAKWLAIYQDDFNRLMDEYIPKQGN